MTLKNTLSRLVLVQALYLIDINEVEPAKHMDIIPDIIKNISEPDTPFNKQDIAEKFINDMLEKIYLHRQTIDDTISPNLKKHNSVDKLNLLLKSILRCATCELYYYRTPFKVVIDEYTKITKDFFSIAETNFVNAILDKIAQHINQKS